MDREALRKLAEEATDGLLPAPPPLELPEPFFHAQAWWWTFGLLEDDEVPAAKYAVACVNAMPALLDEVKAAESRIVQLEVALGEWHAPGLCYADECRACAALAKDPA